MVDAKKAEAKPAGEGEARQGRPAKPEAPQAHPKPVSEKPHRIKVTQMSLNELEEALSICQKSMGGFHSHYARALLARKEFLSGSFAPALPKAA